jgi:DNA-binding beta-propeller fold protein YncE
MCARTPDSSRRALLAGATATVLAAPWVGWATAERAAVLLIPGYRPDLARLRGWPVAHHPELARGVPTGWRGPRSLLSRVGPDGSIARAVLPIAIHHVAPAPDRRRAFVNSLEGDSFLLIDLAGLEVEALLAPHAEGLVGGGHAVWSSEGAVVYVTERRIPGPFSGDPAAHQGRVVVRDGADGRVLAVWPSGGIGPHDIALLPDGRTLAVAHYGSPDSGRGPNGPKAPGVVEPSIVFLDRRDGRLLDRLVGPDRGLEIRHLTGIDATHVVAIQTRLLEGDETLAGGPPGDLIEADDTVAPGLVFAPAPLLDVRRTREGWTAHAVPTPEPWAFRQGQSLVFDPRHGEVIATFPSAHALVVLDARTASVRRVIRTTAMGLARPRGVGLLPDGRHYVVSGHWRGLLVLRRGEHRPVFERSRLDLPLFGHSHLTVV